MNKLLWIAVILVLVYASVLGVALDQQNKQIIRLTGLINVKNKLPALDTKILATNKPKNIFELSSYLATKHWTELYRPSTTTGDFAISVLTDFRFKEKLVNREDAKAMYSNGLSSDEQSPSIAFSECGGELMTPVLRSTDPDSEHTPGIVSLAMYSKSADYKKSTSLYFSPGWDSDELQNRWPILFGPYSIGAADAVKAFDGIRCMELADLK